MRRRIFLIQEPIRNLTLQNRQLRRNQRNRQLRRNQQSQQHLQQLRRNRRHLRSQLPHRQHQKPPVQPVPPTGTKGDPVELATSNLNGKSRLGGLSLNRVHGRDFIRDLIATAGLSRDLADEYVDDVVDVILSQIPDELNVVFPEKQIRQTLTANNPTSIFQIDEPQLDYESFGNAITPSLLSALFNQVDPFTQKYLTSDNLNLYVRVPNTLENGRVEFRVNDYILGNASRITPEQFQADTIPYTFRLDESLAAANLPSWPRFRESALFRCCATVFTRRIG